LEQNLGGLRPLFPSAIIRFAQGPICDGQFPPGIEVVAAFKLTVVLAARVWFY